MGRLIDCETKDTETPSMEALRLSVSNHLDSEPGPHTRILILLSFRPSLLVQSDCGPEVTESEVAQTLHESLRLCFEFRSDSESGVI